jgi:hypothetical protein
MVKSLKIGSKKPKTKKDKLILPSGLSEVELLKARIAKLEAAVNPLLEQAGFRIIYEDKPQDGSIIRFGD